MNTNKFYGFLFGLVVPFFWLFRPFKAIGREGIPEGGLMLCANHSGLSDPLYIIFAMGRRRRPRIMAKEELRKIPVIGFILHKIGLIWVKRGENDITAIKTSLKVLKGGEQLLIFPEGTRHDEVGEGKTGAAMMAIRAGVPILPVYVPPKKKSFRATPVVFGEAYMPFTEDRKATAEDYQQVTEDLMTRIAALRERIS